MSTDSTVTAKLPSRQQLEAAIAAHTPMLIDWSETTADPEATYYGIWEDGIARLGLYATEQAAWLGIADMIYGRGDDLQERYATEPGHARFLLDQKYKRNIPRFAASFEVREVKLSSPASPAAL